MAGGRETQDAVAVLNEGDDKSMMSMYEQQQQYRLQQQQQYQQQQQQQHQQQQQQQVHTVDVVADNSIASKSAAVMTTPGAVLSKQKQTKQRASAAHSLAVPSVLPPAHTMPLSPAADDAET
jgi:ATPase subunit of ABC transporter with duplicated ATPase domains